MPRSMGHQSKKPSNRRKSEREREGEKVREIGPGMIANCLSNGCHPGSHFRWLVIRHERGRPARIPLLTLLLSGPPYLSASGYHQWPPILKLLCPSPFQLLSPCLSLSHFASSSPQCVSLAPAQQLLFSDRSVKQKMMLGIKNRSWSKAQPPYSHNLLFCISSETLGIHSEVIICYSGAPCLSGTNDEVTSERAINEREIICYLTMLDNHRLVGLFWKTFICKSHFLSLLISSRKTVLVTL